MVGPVTGADSPVRESHRWIEEYSVYRAEYSQPIIEKHYSSMIPDMKTPVQALYMANMAQIYPEDRGTNYAIRSGRQVADLVDAEPG